MQWFFSDLPSLNLGGMRLVGRLAFAFLVVAAATIGALGGLHYHWLVFRNRRHFCSAGLRSFSVVPIRDVCSVLFERVV